MLQRVYAMLRKDLLLEWRQKYSLYGLALYLCSNIFLLRVLQSDVDAEVWNSFFWLILLFVTVNAVAKSFLQEHKSRNLYYFTLNDPREFILSKIIYNVILMLVMSAVSLLLFWFFLGIPKVQLGKFILLTLLAGISLSLLFTMLSAIASKAGGNSALIAILGFPLVVPQLIILSNLSLPLFVPMAVTGWWSFVGILMLMDLLIIILSFILFPYLWRD